MFWRLITELRRDVVERHAFEAEARELPFGLCEDERLLLEACRARRSNADARIGGGAGGAAASCR